MLSIFEGTNRRSLLAVCLSVFTFNVFASNWIPISVGDITTFVPNPSVEQLDTNAYQQGSSVAINVGSINSTQAFYYRQLDLSTGQYDAWQCSTAAEVAANGGKIEDDGLSPGNYQYQVSACMTGNGCNVSAFQSGSLACSENALSAKIEVKDTSGIRTASASSTRKDHVGLTPAEFRVSESGAATYNVPIAMPKGTAGVQPQISLNYSSQGGDGYMGRGWNISGAAAITRCPKTFVHDNKIDGVKFNKADRLCLNGQRLIKNGSTTDFATSDSSYWSTSARYHTEIDSFSYVTPHYSGSVLKGFTVQTKSGEVHYYGDTSAVTGNSLLGKPLSYTFKDRAGNQDKGVDAFVELKSNNNIARLWALKAIKDIKNNYFLYKYYENKTRGEHYVTEVQYTGNTSQNQSPYAYVKFNYVDNPRKSSGWQAGTPVSMTKLLGSVQSFVDGAEYRTYKLTYNKATYVDQKNYLEMIQECVGSACLKPLTFYWTTKYNSMQNAYNPFSATALTAGKSSVTARLFDISGDGYTDMVYADGGKWKVKLGPSFTSEKVIYSGKTNKSQHALVFDYDGDSVLDLLVANSTTDKWTILTYNSKDFTTTSTEQDCRRACIDFERKVDYKHTTITASGLEGKTQILDVDGDTLSDIVMASGKNLYYYKNQGNGGFDGARVLISPPAESESVIQFHEGFTNQAANLKNASALDVNGDGRSDILYQDKTVTAQCRIGNEILNISGGNCADQGGTQLSNLVEYNWKLYVSNGGTSYKYVQTVSRSRYFEPTISDLNGDGLSDLVYRAGTEWNYMLSNGTKFGAVQTFKLYTAANNESAVSVREENKDRVMFIDVTGDGRADMLSPNWGATSWSVYTSVALPDSPERIRLVSRGSIAFNKDHASQFTDINGDGKLDFLQSDGSGNWKAYRGGLLNKVEDVITRVDNGFGVNNVINYATINSSAVYYNDKSSHQYTSTGALIDDYISPKTGYTVVSRVTSDTNTGTRNAVRYEYGGLLIHKNGRGMLGFERLRTRDLQTCKTVNQNVFNPVTGQSSSVTVLDENSCMITETVYHQKFPYIGMPLETRQTLGLNGILVSKSENTLIHKQTEFKGILPYIKDTKETSYALNKTLTGSNAVKVTESTFSYDTYGNQKVATIYERDAANPTKNYRLTRSSSEYGTAVSHLRMGRLSSTEVIKRLWENGTLVKSAANDDGTTTRKSAFQYNSDLMLWKESLEPGNTQYEITTTHGYDKWGNKTSTSTNGGVNKSGTSKQTRATSSTYDSRGRYVESTTNALGHKSFVDMHGNKGGSKGRILYTVATSPNNITSTSWMDEFGQAWRSQITSSGANDPTLESRTYQAFCDSSGVACPAGGQYRVIEASSGAPEKQSFFDKWGRPIKSQVKAFDGSWTVTTQEYDANGQLKKSSEPGKNSASGYVTEMKYDRLRRVVEEKRPRGTITREYAGITTHTTDELGLIQSETRDYLGQVKFITNSSASSVQQTKLTYKYSAGGQLLNALVYKGNTYSHIQVSNEYDDQGHRTKMKDLDKGDWTYSFNAFGEMVEQKQANDNLVTTINFDIAGRKLNSKDADGYTDYQYDSGSYAKGKLTRVRYFKGKSSASGTPNFQESYTFASHGKAKETNLLIDGEWFKVEQYYDEFNRPYYTKYPANNFTIKQTYTSLGYASETINVTDGHRDYGKVYQKITAMNARGQVTQVQFANGIKQTTGYDSNTGWMSSINVSKGSSFRHSLLFMYDDKGNLKSRDHDYAVGGSAHDFVETFYYDSLNRLDYRRLATGGTTTTQDYDYDKFGNIIKKQGTGYYKYDGTRKNRLAEVWTDQNFSGTRTHNFSYDNRGNVKGDGKRTFKYTAFDKPYQITSGSTVADFYYGPGRQLYRQKLTKGGKVTDTLYVKGMYERTKLETGVTEHKYNVGSIVVTDRSNNDNDTLYLHKDSLGSTISITDHNGSVLQHFTYDPWGKQNAFQAHSSLVPYSSPATSQGYTGHKMINDIGIIHMGGRIYDQSLGRFLQADPFIQAPNYSQSYNRYSYIMNNPLSGTDPSGYISLSKVFSPLLRPLIKLSSNIIGPELTNVIGNILFYKIGGPLGSAYWTYNFTRAQGGSQSGALRGAFTAAASAFALQGIGDSGYWGQAGSPQNIFANAMVGGIAAELQGGKFGHGFLAAGFTSAFKPMVNQIGGGSANYMPVRVIAAAIIGGTASKISGGKFANGATTGAFVQLYNGETALKKLRDMRAHLKPTDAEYKLVEEGKLAEMWQSRCERGDPIGCVGYGTWGDPGEVAKNAGKYWVGVGATVRANAYAGLYMANGSAPSDELMLQFGQDIAVAHLDATAVDNSSVLYYLSAPEITSYHHTVFDSYGVNRGFYGGSWITGHHDRVAEVFYCQPACDWGTY